MDYLKLKKIAEYALEKTDAPQVSYTELLLRGILAALLYMIIVQSNYNSRM